MKKFFAAALATAMVVSMAATSFAAIDANEKVMGNSGASEYDADLSPKFFAAGDKIAYGDTVYYQLKSADGYVTKYDAVKGTSITQKWEMNGASIEKLEIVKKKYGNDADHYAYYLAVKTKANNITSTTDVVGTVTLRKTGTDGFVVPTATGTTNELKIPVNFVLGYDEVTNFVIGSSAKVMKFTSGDQTITFDKAPNNFFDVNTDGQGKLVVKADVKYNADVAAKYPAANLDFFNCNGATFNKIGELAIAAAPNSFLYQVNADGNLVAVKASYDEYQEAFKFKTRTLGTYVISDVELKLTATTPVDPAKPNPGTGANA